MSTGLHSDQVGVEVHTPFRQVFADAAARLADATVYTALDINKVAFQVDSGAMYYLSAITPVWSELNAAIPATDHGALSGLGDDDHTQYLTEARHDALAADNPHSVTAAQAGAEPVNANIQTHVTDVTGNPHVVTASQVGAEPANANIQFHVGGPVGSNPHGVTFSEAVTADAGTDISAVEAETLTDGSYADALHQHTFDVTNQLGIVSAQMDAKIKVDGEGIGKKVVVTFTTDSYTTDADGIAVDFNTGAGAGSDAIVTADVNGIRLDQKPLIVTKFKILGTTSVRFFAGLFDEGAVATDDNVLDTTEGVGVVYSSDRPDTNFQFVAHDGTTQTLVDSGVVADTLAHYIVVDATSGTSVTVSLLDASKVLEASTTFTTELPVATFAMSFWAGVTTITGIKTIRYYFQNMALRADV